MKHHLVELSAPHVHIVGPPDGLRNTRLIDDLRSQGCHPVLTRGCTRGFLESLSADSVDAPRSVVLKHRALLPGEVAATLAHRSAVESACADRQPWGIFLEDDAEIEENFGDAVRYLLRLSFTRPVVLSLYQDPLLRTLPVRSRPLLRRPLGLPEGAVGYMLNRAAMTAYPVNGPVTGVADWPYPWIARVSFFQVSPAVVSAGDYPSMIGAWRGWEHLSPPIWQRIANVISVVSSLRYHRHRHVYGRWRDYAVQEYGRLLHAVAGVRFSDYRRERGA